MTLTEAREAEREAMKAVNRAKTDLDQATYHNVRCEKARWEWQHSTREPTWAEGLRKDGTREADGRKPDIPLHPPLPAEFIAECEKSLAKAQKTHERLRAELEEAAAAQAARPKPDKPTGLRVRRPMLFDGLEFERGDWFPSDVDGDKVDSLIGSRAIEKVG